MPMFYIPQPRRFNYQPRFYDPKKERWEALKQKYADERQGEGVSEEELAYFEQRVRNLEKPERSKLTWKDMFRKREMPKFDYKPRFSGKNAEEPSEAAGTAAERMTQYKKENTKIKRRFDYTEHTQRKQQKVWIYAAVVIAVTYTLYRKGDAVVQFLYDLFF